jgi:hypothetical protein
MVPENVNSGRSADFKTPRKKIIEPPARMMSPLPSSGVDPQLNPADGYARQPGRRLAALGSASDCRLSR